MAIQPAQMPGPPGPTGAGAPAAVPPAAPRGRPDQVLVDLQASGELLVAQVRVVLLGVLLLLQLVRGAAPEIRRITLAFNLVALVVAVLFYVLAARRPRPWMAGFASSAADVTLVSAGLAAFLLAGQPHAAVGSRQVFDLYFLAIICASLRYNPQTCALTGLLAIAQYAALVLYAAARWNLNDLRYAPFRDGMFDWNAQAARLLSLGGVSLITALIVMRAHVLRQPADVDRLTGVANRLGFDQRLATEADRAYRSWRPLAVALVEIADLEGINQRAGRSAGDALLRAMGRALSGAVRRSDVVARLGGGTFALLLPETTAQQVFGKLERLRRDIAAQSARKAAAPRINLGVASWPDDGEQIPQVMAVAQERLLGARRAGAGVGGPVLGRDEPAAVSGR